MNVVAFPSQSLRLGVPLPVSLRDETGRLLLARGSVIDSDRTLKQLVSRGVYVDAAESYQFTRAMAGKIDDLVRRNATLGQIAAVTVEDCEDLVDNEVFEANLTLDAAWGQLVSRLNSLLVETPGTGFLRRLLQIQSRAASLLKQSSDAALLVLIQLKHTEGRLYSANHALLVMVLCELAAQGLPEFNDDHRQSLRCAALSMNVAMTTLQDQLSHQIEPPNPRQRDLIDSHCKDGADLLRAAGIRDERWLYAVEHHHDRSKNTLEGLPIGEQMARLIQRADVFCARLSGRAKRKGLSATAAAQAAYLGVEGKADQAGAAIIKATGLYPPGTYVSLANGETAIVLKRGMKANWPKAASIIGREGLPLGTPSIRDTRSTAFTVKGSVPAHEIKVRMPLERLIGMIGSW
jgi:HD-GYP domain-containing protein (c-di-GMP phosphodiesterase class II)